MKPVVFLAHSLEEAQCIESSQEKWGYKEKTLHLFIRVWVLWANVLLLILQRILFHRPPHAASDVQHVAVYTVGTLGDNILMLPAVAALKNRYSTAKLTVVTNCDGYSDYGAKAVWGRAPFVDALVTLPTHPVQRKGYHIVTQSPLNIADCDLFVNLSPFGNRGWLGAVVREMLFARSIGACTAIGFHMRTYRRKNYFNRVEHRFRENEAVRSRSVLVPLGVVPVENVDLLPYHLNARKRVRQIVDTHAKPGQFIAVLNPGAKLKASYWPAERFGQLARQLADDLGACVLINGAPNEKETCRAVAAAAGGLAVDLAGNLSIEELIELLRLTSLCVTNNTAPMTLTAMLGVPTVVLCSTRFSPTFYMPVSNRSYWLFSFTEDSYSYDDKVVTSPDLLNIAVEDVMQAVKEVLGDHR